ncbi:uncharacterized protein LOC118406513 [Branchiostoma floridae]|uniref:Gypsy retrotransposon integrase-like protein 1 n=1 Tax=Branchiostoma floridae TaxID=7739 RepID=A0A9J7KJK5_BRAFL|nr:uncharacterized protein LOC118406513 [Branchiostoma floridae]
MDPRNYVSIRNYVSGNGYPEDVKTKEAKRAFRKKAKPFALDGNGTLVYKKKINDQKQKKEILVKVLKAGQTEEVFHQFHTDETGGHSGREKTIHAIAVRFYWPDQSVHINKWVRECKGCQAMKNMPSGVRTLQPIKVTGPWDLVGMDLIGPLPETSRGNRYIFSATDYFTKWVEAYPIADKSAVSVAACIMKMYTRHGAAKAILTDQGKEFNNKVNDLICNAFKTKHKVTAAYHPQTNGLDERTNGNIKRALTKLGSSNDWDTKLDGVLYSLRTKKQTTTKYSPFHLLYGREAVFPAEMPEIPLSVNNLLPSLDIPYDDRVRQIAGEREKTRGHVMENIEAVQAKYKGRSKGRKRAKQEELKPGMFVSLKNSRKKTREGSSLEPNWLGPYVIEGMKGKTVMLKDIETSKTKKTNIDHVQKYTGSLDTAVSTESCCAGSSPARNLPGSSVTSDSTEAHKAEADHTPSESTGGTFSSETPHTRNLPGSSVTSDSTEAHKAEAEHTPSESTGGTFSSETPHTRNLPGSSVTSDSTEAHEAEAEHTPSESTGGPFSSETPHTRNLPGSSVTSDSTEAHEAEADHTPSESTGGTFSSETPHTRNLPGSSVTSDSTEAHEAEAEHTPSESTGGTFSSETPHTRNLPGSFVTSDSTEAHEAEAEHTPSESTGGTFSSETPHTRNLPGSSVMSDSTEAHEAEAEHTPSESTGGTFSSETPHTRNLPGSSVTSDSTEAHKAEAEHTPSESTGGTFSSETPHTRNLPGSSVTSDSTEAHEAEAEHTPSESTGGTFSSETPHTRNLPGSSVMSDSTEAHEAEAEHTPSESTGGTFSSETPHTRNLPGSSVTSDSTEAHEAEAQLRRVTKSDEQAAALVNNIRRLDKVENNGLYLGKVGSYPLLVMDLQTLIKPKAWLNDAVINAVLYSLVQTAKSKVGDNILLIDSIILTRIILRNRFTEGILNKIGRAVHKHSLIIGAINESSHWTLVAVYPETHKILYFNSFGEKRCSMKKVIDGWSKFMVAAGDKALWTTTPTASHPHQKDSHSCGLYVIQFAQHLLMGTPIDIEDVDMTRMTIARSLLASTEDLSYRCSMCGEMCDHEKINCNCQYPFSFHAECLKKMAGPFCDFCRWTDEEVQDKTSTLQFQPLNIPTIAATGYDLSDCDSLPEIHGRPGIFGDVMYSQGDNILAADKSMALQDLLTSDSMLTKKRQHVTFSDKTPSTQRPSRPRRKGANSIASSLVEMGFELKAAKQAAKHTADLESAVDWVLEHSESDSDQSDSDESDLPEIATSLKTARDCDIASDDDDDTRDYRAVNMSRETQQKKRRLKTSSSESRPKKRRQQAKSSKINPGPSCSKGSQVQQWTSSTVGAQEIAELVKPVRYCGPYPTICGFCVW